MLIYSNVFRTNMLCLLIGLRNSFYEQLVLFYLCFRHFQKIAISHYRLLQACRSVRLSLSAWNNSAYVRSIFTRLDSFKSEIT
jgi:hypothetical protein